MKFSPYLDMQERLLLTGLRTGCIELSGPEWQSARSLVRRGFGAIVGETRANKRKVGRFVLLPAGIAAAEELKAFNDAQALLRRDPSYHARAIAAAAKAKGLESQDLLRRAKYPRHVRARWAVMLCLSKRQTGLKAIGRRLNLEHSTVRYGIVKARALVARDAGFAALVQKVDAA